MGTKKKEQLLVSVLGSCSGKSSDDEGYSDSKWSKTSGFKNKMKTAGRVGKGRAKNMALGAASIINKWPEHLLLCWLGSIAFILFVIGGMLVISDLGKRSSPMTHQELCLLKNTHASKKDLHHMETNIFLHVIVNSHEHFEPSKYKEVLTSTVKHHPNFILNVYILFNDMIDSDYKRNSKFRNWEVYHKGNNKYKFFDTSSADIDNDVIATEVEIEDSKNIKIVQSTFSSYFKHSPLRNSWKNIPPKIIPMVLRILSLWEHGGISLSWNMFLDKTNIYCENKSVGSKLKNLVAELKRNYSESYVVPVDPSQIKKETIDNMKHELRDITVEHGLDLSGTSEIQQVLKKIKESHTQLKNNKIKSNTGIYTSKQKLFLTVSEEKLAAIRDRSRLPYDLQGDSSSYDSSYYYEYYSSSEYESDSYDGLPDSTESKSNEFSLRPTAAPGFIENEIKRYVNFKRNNEDPINKETTQGRRKLLSLTLNDKEAHSSSHVIKENVLRNKNKLKQDLNNSELRKTNLKDIKLKEKKYNTLNNDIDSKEHISLIPKEIKQEKLKLSKNDIEKINEKKLPRISNKMKNDNIKYDIVKDISENDNKNKLPKISNDEVKQKYNKVLLKDNTDPNILKNSTNEFEQKNSKNETRHEKIKYKELNNRTETKRNDGIKSPKNNKQDLRYNVHKKSIPKYYERDVDSKEIAKLVLESNKEIRNPFVELKESNTKSDERFQKMKENLQRMPILAKPVVNLQNYNSASDEKHSSSSSGYLSRSDSNSYMSLEKINKMLNPISREFHHHHQKVKDSNDYQYNKMLEALNIFVLPNKLTLTLDYSGFYFSARKPCHAFLWELILLLKSKLEFNTPADLTKVALNKFCHNQDISQCNGIELL